MRKISYAGYRFPPEVIHPAIWLYLRFTLSYRDVEDLLAERWNRGLLRDGPSLGEPLRTDDCSAPSARRPKPHAIWHLDEVYLKIAGRMVCGAPSTPRARSSTCWSNPSATSTPL
jgi:putative transposase